MESKFNEMIKKVHDARAAHEETLSRYRTALLELRTASDAVDYTGSVVNKLELELLTCLAKAANGER